AVRVLRFTPGPGTLALRGTDPGRRIQEKARTRPRGERSEIDAAISGAVVPRDDAGNHPRVEGVATRTQQGKVNAFGRRIAEALQYGEMAVPSPDEKKMFHRVLEACVGHANRRDTLRTVCISEARTCQNPSDWETSWRRVWKV